MKKFLLASVALATLCGASNAFAADLPSRKAPVVVVPPPLWTGLYAGVNIGGGIGTNSNAFISSIGPYSYVGTQTRPTADLPQQITALGPSVIQPSGIGSALSPNMSNTQSGFIGGGQIGYNFQASQNFVIGAEADIQGSTIAGSSNGNGVGAGAASWAGLPATTNTPPILPLNVDAVPGQSSQTSAIGTTHISGGVNWFGTARGRVGYLATPTLLLYGTAGLTYGGVYANVRQSAFLTTTTRAAPAGNGVYSGAPTSVTQSFFGGGNKNQTNIGWNAGGGLEWMFKDNWSFKAEAIYWNLGNLNVVSATVSPAGATSSNVRVNYQGVIGRAGVNYHFNLPTPAAVVAKY